MSDVKPLFACARAFRERAYAPYSHYRVGAAVLDEQGRVFGGCNIENCNYGGTVCAERVAIWRAIAEGAQMIRALAVVVEEGQEAKPCGFCRQIMAEFAAPDFKLYLAWPNESGYLCLSLEDILPHAFRPADLR